LRDERVDGIPEPEAGAQLGHARVRRAEARPVKRPAAEDRLERDQQRTLQIVLVHGVRGALRLFGQPVAKDGERRPRRRRRDGQRRGGRSCARDDGCGVRRLAHGARGPGIRRARSVHDVDARLRRSVLDDAFALRGVRRCGGRLGLRRLRRPGATRAGSRAGAVRGSARRGVGSESAAAIWRVRRRSSSATPAAANVSLVSATATSAIAASDSRVTRRRWPNCSITPRHRLARRRRLLPVDRAAELVAERRHELEGVLARHAGGAHPPAHRVRHPPMARDLDPDVREVAPEDDHRRLPARLAHAAPLPRAAAGARLPQHRGVVGREVGRDQHLAEVPEHPAELRRLRIPGADAEGCLTGVARGEQREQHQLLQPGRAAAVVLEQEQRRGEVADVARAEEHQRVRRALDGAPGPVVVRRVRGADDLHRHRVVPQDQVREPLRRRFRVRQRRHQLAHHAGERREVLRLEDALHERVHRRLGSGRGRVVRVGRGGGRWGHGREYRPHAPASVASPGRGDRRAWPTLRWRAPPTPW
jgi:hypothetical protein